MRGVWIAAALRDQREGIARATVKPSWIKPVGFVEGASVMIAAINIEDNPLAFTKMLPFQSNDSRTFPPMTGKNG